MNTPAIPTNKRHDALRNAILNRIKLEVHQIIEEEAENAGKAAAANVSHRIRRLTGQIAATVASEFNIERWGTDLRITVKLPEPPQK